MLLGEEKGQGHPPPWGPPELCLVPALESPPLAAGSNQWQADVGLKHSKAPSGLPGHSTPQASQGFTGLTIGHQEAQ